MEWNCNECGACCVGMRVPVPHGENIRGHVGEVNKALMKRRLPLVDRNNCMPGKDTGCLALGGVVGTKAAICTIYEDRPQVCEQFSPGSAQCLQSRLMHGIDTAPGPVKFIARLNSMNGYTGHFPRDLAHSVSKYYRGLEDYTQADIIDDWLMLDDERENSVPPTMAADGVDYDTQRRRDRQRRAGVRTTLDDVPKFEDIDVLPASEPPLEAGVRETVAALTSPAVAAALGVPLSFIDRSALEEPKPRPRGTGGTIF